MCEHKGRWLEGTRRSARHQPLHTLKPCCSRSILLSSSCTRSEGTCGRPRHTCRSTAHTDERHLLLQHTTAQQQQHEVHTNSPLPTHRLLALCLQGLRVVQEAQAASLLRLVLLGAVHFVSSTTTTAEIALCVSCGVCAGWLGCQNAVMDVLNACGMTAQRRACALACGRGVRVGAVQQNGARERKGNASW